MSASTPTRASQHTWPTPPLKPPPAQNPRESAALTVPTLRPHDPPRVIMDALHGRCVIHEPLLKDLLECQAMRRLRGVMQHGITALVGLTGGMTRYDHCVGAMLLVRRLGGSLNEQIAALLHDVSHTAFSHVVDYAFAGPQSFHEAYKESYIGQTDIPTVLARYNLDWRTFLHEANFALLAQPAPGLCADRLDDGLRDAISFGLITRAEAGQLLQHLIVHKGRMAMSHVDAARRLGEIYLRADAYAWSNPKHIALYNLTGRLMAVAWQCGAYALQHLWEEDQVFWQRLQNCQNREANELRTKIRADLQLIACDLADAHLRFIPKTRTLDPEVVVADAIVPLSQVDPGYARVRRDYLASKRGPMSFCLYLPVARDMP